MKNNYIILIILVLASFGLNAQSYSDGCMTLTIKATRAYCQEYEDPIANDEPDWQWWFLDNANLDGDGWNGGTCLAFDSYNNSWHVGWWNHSINHGFTPTIFNETYGASGPNNASVPQYVSLRGHFEGDDSGGSCDGNTGFFVDNDDYRYDETVASNIAYRFGAPNSNNTYQVITTNHGSSDYGGEFTMNWTSPRPVVTASTTEICQGETTSVTLSLSGAVFGGSYQIYDGASLVASTTSSTWSVSLSSSKTYSVYTRNNGVNSNCYSLINIITTNCDFNCVRKEATMATQSFDASQGNVEPSDISFNSAGIPTNSYIADVNVDISFDKTDGSCGSPATGSSFHSEIYFWLFSENNGGTTESTSLVNGTFSTSTNISPGVTVNFDQDAASTPSGTPVNGASYRPDGTGGVNLDFEKWEPWDLSSSRDWYIRAGDSGSGDPLCVIDYGVTVCGCKPPTAGSAYVTDGASSSNSSITICEEQGGTISLSTTGSSSAFDAQGYGDELRWYSGSCGGTYIGSGNPLVIAAPSSPGTHKYFAQFYVDGEKCRNGNYCDQVDVIVDAKTEEGHIETLIGGNLSADICETTLPPSLTIASNVGAVVIWQQSTDGATFTDVVGTVGSTVYIPAGGLLLPVGSYYFRAKIKNNTCDEKVTANFVLNIKETPVGGTISPNPTQNVCHGDMWTFTLSSNVGNIQWQESNSVGGPFTDVLTGGSTDTYIGTASNLTTSAISKFYRVEMRNTPCASSASNVVQLISHPAPFGGTTASNQVLCYDETPSSINLSGHTGGGVSNWEIDTDPLFGSPTVVANMTTTLSGLNVRTAMGSPLNQTLFVRAIVDNAGCPETESTDVELEINSPNNIGSSTQSGDCNISSNTWVHIFDASSKEIIASIDANGQNLGNVTASVYYHGGSSFTIPATGTCTQPQAVMNRSFVINSANSVPNPVGVRLYFKDTELADLIDNSLSSQTTGGATSWAVHDPSGCEDDDDLLNINDLYVTQISNSGVSENGTFDPGVGDFNLINPSSNSGVGNSHFGADYVEFSVTGFSEFWLHGSESGVPLPVELLDFAAQSIDNKLIHLDWKTASEINNEGFELQRSTDGMTFNKIAWIDGFGNSNEQQVYRFEDNSVSAGVYYYRLKQIDFDGEYEYSEIKSASILGGNGMSLSFFIPNPTANSTQLKFNLVQPEKVLVKIMDNLGRLVTYKIEEFEAGSHTMPFDVNEFSAGVYTAKVLIGNEEFTRKLVVRK